MSTYLFFKAGDISQKVDIGVRVVTYEEPGAPSFYAPGGTFRRLNRLEAGLEGTRKDKVDKVIIHHDVAYSAKSCFSILMRRHLSTHLMVDADGTVYQPINLSDEAYHAGFVNPTSVGIDMNNPVIPSSRAADQVARGVFHGVINGGKVASLGYTEAQYVSLAAVLEGLFQIFPKIQRQAPIGEGGKVPRNKLINTAFSGIMGHYHVSANKWDPGPGFDWERVLIAIRGNQYFFPVSLKGYPNLAHVSKAKALEAAQPYFRNTEEGEAGFFPVGADQTWHTGIHLDVPEGTPVLAPAAGKVVVARNTEPLRMGSPNVVVIRHDVKVGTNNRTFFSVLSHLRQENLRADSEIPWIRRLYQQPGPDSLPPRQVGEKPSAPGLIALLDKRVALLDVEIKAGEVVGYVGGFATAADGSDLKPLVDCALFSDRPILPPGDRTFLVVDEDPEPDLMVNSRTVWKHFTTNPEALRGLVEGGYPLARSEIQAIYQGTGTEAGRENAYRGLRWLAVRHATEYSDQTDFAALFGAGVDFEWSARKEARRYLQQIKDFLWWDDGVTAHLELPQDRVIVAYHPIAVLSVLARGEAQKVLQPGETGYEKAYSGAELDAQRRQDSQAEIDSGEIHSHEDADTRAFVGSGEDLDEYRLDDPSDETWLDRWEQGEWDPE